MPSPVTRTAPVFFVDLSRAAENFPAQRASAGTAAGCEGELVTNVHLIRQPGNGQRILFKSCDGAGSRDLSVGQDVIVRVAAAEGDPGGGDESIISHFGGVEGDGSPGD